MKNRQGLLTSLIVPVGVPSSPVAWRSVDATPFKYGSSGKSEQRRGRTPPDVVRLRRNFESTETVIEPNTAFRVSLVCVSTA
jgi:hypothetical protein